MKKVLKPIARVEPADRDGVAVVDGQNGQPPRRLNELNRNLKTTTKCWTPSRMIPSRKIAIANSSKKMNRRVPAAGLDQAARQQFVSSTKMRMKTSRTKTTVSPSRKSATKTSLPGKRRFLTC